LLFIVIGVWGQTISNRALTATTGVQLLGVSALVLGIGGLFPTLIILIPMRRYLRAKRAYQKAQGRRATQPAAH